MTAPEPVSDALTVARWVEPSIDRFDAEGRMALLSYYETDAGLLSAERLMVERGLGEAYGETLFAAMPIVVQGMSLGRRIAAIRTAPLSTVLRALAAVVRAEAEKKA